jgi:hypothetical protein
MLTAKKNIDLFDIQEERCVSLKVVWAWNQSKGKQMILVWMDTHFYKQCMIIEIKKFAPDIRTNVNFYGNVFLISALKKK